MRALLVFMLSIAFSPAAFAVNVLDQSGRAQSLLEYLADRNDLTKAEKATWEKALRIVFGGQALRPGDDEGITAAKSVLAFGLFHRLDAMLVVQAAYDAKNDVYAWVPPPVAIKYQALALQGRKPKEPARLLAFEFPKYYDEELAPEMVAWWQQQLKSGKVNPDDEPRMRRQLEETQKKLKPRLREIAYQGAQIEAMVKNNKANKELVSGTLASIDEEIASGLGQSGQGSFGEYYDLYARLSKELHLAVAPPPVPEKSEQPKTTLQPKPTPQPKATPQPKPDADRPAIADARPSGAMRQPPMPGEQLCPTYAGWQNVWATAITKWIGTKYLFGGTGQGGIDCSAFSREVFRDTARIELPRVSVDQFRTGLPIDKAQLRKGDLVFFDTLERGRITHVAVFDGEGLVAHATSSRGVTSTLR